jgi:hypothetical protein
MKIGITLGIKEEGESLWINGIKLNILMLATLLKNSDKNYDVRLLVTTHVKVTDALPWDLKEFPTYDYETPEGMECDLIIILGGQINDVWLKKFKDSDPNKRVVSYKCGNNYVMSMENILFIQKGWIEGEATKIVERQFDEVWYVPQQQETCHHYWSALHRVNVIPVPFLYDSRWIDTLKPTLNSLDLGLTKWSRGAEYKPINQKWRLTIMEPNLNIVKWSMIPTLIAEESYRREFGKENIELLSVTNGFKVIRKGEYIGIMNSLDIHKDKKVFWESRYNTPYFLSQYSDILICHQLLNPLNYLYLDAAHLGYPVLHNAWMCKDLGYYYEGQNIQEGSKMLDKIMLEHDDNMEEYKKQTEKVIERYSVHNPELIKTYDRLIENVFNGKTENLKYNPATNLYEE